MFEGGRVRACVFTLAGAFAAAAFADAGRPAPSPSPSSPTVSARLTRELARVRDAALASPYALAQAAWLTNGIGPRLSGSRGAAAAVEFVAGELARQGLAVRREPVKVPHWERGRESAELTGWPGRPGDLTQKLVVCALGGSVATPKDGLTAPVVVVDSYEALEALPDERVAGAIVVFNVTFDAAMAAQGRGGDAYSQAVAYRTGGAAAAGKRGAAASLVRSVGSAEFRLPHTGNQSYAPGAPKIPAGALGAEDAALVAWHAARGPTTLHLTLTPRTLPEADSFNVVADLKGTEFPDEVVIVSGHLDSWDLGTGAIDDAAGVAVAMAAPVLLKQLGLAPRRTIRVVAWMNEENGMAGQKTYARVHQAELARHIAAIESDGGAGHPLGAHVNVGAGANTILDPIARVLSVRGAGVIETVEHPVGPDLGSLGAAGVPTLSLMQDERSYFHYHHTAADTFDKIVPRELAENAMVMAVLAYGLAMTDRPLHRPATEFQK